MSEIIDRIDLAYVHILRWCLNLFKLSVFASHIVNLATIVNIDVFIHHLLLGLWSDNFTRIIWVCSPFWRLLLSGLGIYILGVAHELTKETGDICFDSLYYATAGATSRLLLDMHWLVIMGHSESVLACLVIVARDFIRKNWSPRWPRCSVTIC